MIGIGFLSSPKEAFSILKRVFRKKVWSWCGPMTFSNQGLFVILVAHWKSPPENI